MTRKTKLEEALAPSLPNDTIRFADMAWGIQSHANRLAPLHAALIEAIENLEDIQAWCRDRTATDGTIYAIGLSRSTEALSKLDKALKLFDSKDGEHNERK
jgi:hypothetical protein